jgi:nitroimidazol reductase NimA-like FMN-containing flavoprotein (pyridoxamine 5'-phosphate oxidase superfamily)
MRIRELDRVECGEVLSRNQLARLACARHGQPYIVPIHYSFDAARKCLYAFSTVGQKVDWMRENPLVCVEVEEIADKNLWTTVLIFGRYEELTDAPEDASARRTAQTLFEGRPQWWFPAAAKVGSREHHEMVLYRILIDRMSGRRTSRQD